MNRRSFLMTSAVAAGVATVFKGALGFAKDALKDLKLKDADVAKTGDKVPVAQYCTDVADKKACPERQKPERKTQYCDGCQFYTAKGLHKGKEVGTCTLIPGKHVPAKAWCQTWVKKAGT